MATLILDFIICELVGALNGVLRISVEVHCARKRCRNLQVVEVDRASLDRNAWDAHAPDTLILLS
jgi:hypothetical protein